MARYSSLYANQCRGAYQIDPMPGQPQVALCHGFFVPQEMRGNGYGHELKARQTQQLQMDGFDFAVCTIRSDNLAQQRIAEQAGWKKLAEFNDSRLGGVTELWGFNVNQ